MGKHGKRLRRQQRALQRQAQSEVQGTQSVASPALRPRADCHNGAVKVWTKGHLHVWCSDRRSLEHHWMAAMGLAGKQFDLYISAAGVTCRADSPVFLTPGAAAVLGYDPRDTDIGDLPHLFIDVYDGAAPRLDAEQWINLAALLNDFVDGPTDTHIVVFCEGGHGRTGTVATVLLYFLGAFDDANGEPEAVDPVWWLRKRYCHEAVETFEQVDYIEKMTGLTVGVEPSWEWLLPQAKAANGAAGSSAPGVPRTVDTNGTGSYSGHPENVYEEVYVRDDNGLWRLTVNKAGDIIYREKITQPGADDDPNVMVDPHTGEVLPRQDPPAYASWLGPADPDERDEWILCGKPDRQVWEGPRRVAADDKPWLRWLPNAAKAVSKMMGTGGAPMLGTGNAPLPPVSTAQEVETH